MTTVVELTAQARKLELKGYSTLRKPELEKMIDDEKRRREDIKLAKIRQEASDVTLLPSNLDGFTPTLDLPGDDFICVEDEPGLIKGMGLNNRQRLGNYIFSDPLRKHVTHAQSRRIRKRWRAGDNSIPDALIFASSDINLFLIG